MNKKYEIFKLSAEWNQKEYKNNRIEYIRGKNIERINLQKWWSNYYKSKKMQSKKPIELIELKIQFLGEYSWWLSWFSHTTYNIFTNEQDAFNDFERFLEEEIGVHVAYGGIYPYEENLFYKNNDKMCLMGASEKWRWEFHDCTKCKDCKINGTMIRH